MSQKNPEEQSNVLIKERVKRPRRFKVIIHNDDFTTMEFVIEVLKTVFHLSSAQSTRVMLSIHRSGIGVAGIFSRDVAETKIEQVTQLAEEEGHPLYCSMEPE